MRRLGTIIVGTVSCAYMAVTLFLFSPMLTDPHIVADDAGQHIAPMYAFVPGVELGDDLITEYKLAYQPPGYLALFRFTAPIIDPLLLGGILTLALIALTWLLSYLIGTHIGGSACGWLCALLVAHAEFISAVMFGGLFRAFGPPLFLLFAYCWIKRRWAWTAATLLMQAFFYPPVFLICAGAIAIYMTVTCKTWLTQQRRALVLICLAALIGLGTLFAFSKKPEHFGEVVKLEKATRMKEWSRHPGGRFSELPFRSHRTMIRKGLNKGLLSDDVGITLAPKLVQWNREHRYAALWAFLAITALGLTQVKNRAEWLLCTTLSGVAWYVLARSCAFQFGWPTRYLNYVLPFVPIFLYALYWRALGVLRARKPLAGACLGMAPLVLVFLLYPLGFTGVKGNKATDTSDMREVVAYVRDMPEPVLFAGWPRYDMDNIYLFAHKKVLVDYEGAHPLYDDYYDEIRRRVRGSIRLCYAWSLERARKLRDEFGVTHLLLRKQMVEDRSYIPRLYEPMRSMATRERNKAWKRGLYFANTPEEAVIYEDEEYFVVDLSRLGEEE